MKKLGLFFIATLCVITLVGCSAGNFGLGMKDGYGEHQTQDEFNEIIENEFIKTSENQISNISLTANTAAYANIRNYIKNNQKPNKNQVRIEEMINYFKYQYQAPTNTDVLATNVKIMDTPWQSDTKLLIIGMQAKAIETENIRNNLVFLLDVSGSMAADNKLPLMQQAFTLLLENLDSNDRVSIVTYAGANKVLLDGAMGSEKIKIEAVISDLNASGSTGGSDGIKTAYKLAEKHFIEGGNNRIILATDGDFNVGISSQKGLEKLVSEKRASGIYLSVLGFGMGNLKDNKLETLANHGNGNYAYIDSLLEVKKALIEDINGTLYTVARDAKAQIVFDKETVDAFRLIGYENRQLSDEAFEDEKTDAGEIGAGHQVTVVYEIKLYEDISETYKIADFKLRYKAPDVNENDVLEQTVVFDSAYLMPSNDDVLFIVSVIEFGLILRDSKFKGDASIDTIITRLTSVESIQSDVYKQEFLELLNQYREMD